MKTEKIVNVLPGWIMLVVTVVVSAGSAFWIYQMDQNDDFSLVYVPVILFALVVTAMPGFFTLQPNEARALILFGKYVGTSTKEGWHWANPFYSNSMGIDKRFKISLRARTNVAEVIKVNDRKGNPIEIAAVVIWKVSDTFKAIFEVDDYRTYVKTQVETALRHVATQFPYDHTDSGDVSTELTLRGNPEEVASELKKDLDRRLAVAGVEISDARLTHLAYAPEIAQAMLRRQQADAVISARRKIVEGAVGMVEMALADLEQNKSIVLDDERKASMVSNLLVVLCSEKDASPVINAGTLYS